MRVGHLARLGMPRALIRTSERDRKDKVDLGRAVRIDRAEFGAVSRYPFFLAISARSSRSLLFTNAAFFGPMRMSTFCPAESCSSEGSANS